MIPAASSATGDSLNGSWERSGRSPNTAALLALLGIGMVYFNGQSILAAIAVFTAYAFDRPDLSGGYLQRLLENMRHLADPLRAAVVVSQYLFMLLPALLLVRWWHSTRIRQYIRLTGASVGETLLAVIATVMIIPAANFIAEVLVRQLGVPEELMKITAEIFTARSPGEFIWLVFVVCITPAFCEEVFFRGFVQRTFERTMGERSVILVGVLFGLFHFSPLGLVTLSVLGMLFGYFFYRSRSLVPPMAAHFVNNFLAVLIMYQDPEGGTLVTMDSTPLWLVGVTLPVGVIALLVYQRITLTKMERAV